jgi:hypothetical protein
VAALYGMWTDREDLYLSPKMVSWYWVPIVVVIWLVAIIGAAAHWRRYRLALVTLGVVRP